MTSALALTMPIDVAVGSGLCDRIGAEHAGLAAAILDHNRLLRDFRHALADQARDDVVGAAGWERHDQLDRFAWENPALPLRQEKRRQSGEAREEFLHDSLP